MIRQVPKCHSLWDGMLNGLSQHIIAVLCMPSPAGYIATYAGDPWTLYLDGTSTLACFADTHCDASTSRQVLGIWAA